MSNAASRRSAIDPHPAPAPAVVDSELLTDEELREVVGGIVANDLGPDNVQKKHLS